MPKLFYFSNLMKANNYKYFVYTHDHSEFAKRCCNDFDVEILYAPPHKKSITRFVVDFFTFYKNLKKNSFNHIELFFDYHVFATFFYFIISRICKTPIITWCRGELYDWNEWPLWKKMVLKYVVRNSRIVVLKELYMKEVLDENKIYPKAELHLYNTVETLVKRKKLVEGKPVRLLFLNMFKPWRHVDFCVEIAKELRSKKIDFCFDIVGENYTSQILIDEVINLKNKIIQNGLGEYMKVYEFTEKPHYFYEQNDIFILPADLIFCNYSLLESMNYGLVPIIYNKDKNHTIIVENGVSGFALELDSTKWAEIISNLAQDINYFHTMSINSNNRIKEKFSTDATIKKYLEKIKKEIN